LLILLQIITSMAGGAQTVAPSAGLEVNAVQSCTTCPYLYAAIAVLFTGCVTLGKFLLNEKDKRIDAMDREINHMKRMENLHKGE